MLNMKDESSYEDKSTVYSEISTEYNNEKYSKTVVAFHDAYTHASNHRPPIFLWNTQSKEANQYITVPQHSDVCSPI